MYNKWLSVMNFIEFMNDEDKITDKTRLHLIDLLMDLEVCIKYYINNVEI